MTVILVIFLLYGMLCQESSADFSAFYDFTIFAYLDAVAHFDTVTVFAAVYYFYYISDFIDFCYKL